MPPPLPEEESNSGPEEEIPFRDKATNGGTEEDEEEEDEDDEEAEEEYVVEKITSHAFNDDGVCLYEVKWLGYEKKTDRTWEPEDNLAGAVDILKEYWKRIGGKPIFGETKTKKRGRRKTKGDDEEEVGTPASSTTNKKARKEEKPWEPPAGSWENDADYIETVEENPDPKTGEMIRHAYIVWNNGKKTQHPLSMINKKCPQNMLRYYEQHLVFKPGEFNDETNGDGEF